MTEEILSKKKTEEKMEMNVTEPMQMPQPGAYKNPRGTIHCITIIGHIEGHVTLPPSNKTTKYEHIVPVLVDLNQNPEIDGVLILLNTVGGDVEAGLAIAELISGMGKPTVSLVLGGGHSIGVPLAVSADYSFIAASGTMTIHPIRMNGTVVGAPQTYDYFQKMQERVTDFTCKNSKMKKTRFEKIMFATDQIALDVGTILIGQEAVDENLIDNVGTLNDAMEKLYEFISKTRKNDKKLHE